uniref:Uncharacterized protein n=1 Tax=Labrus bergylta TaxID=56723 RepID=A0A3Q3EJ86_9LABR
MTSLPFPAPVHVGVVTTGGEHAQLHKYTVERNLNKIERLLKRGDLTITTRRRTP